MEPTEGKYELDWVERAVRMAERHHIAVVLGTPSAAPPAWLTRSIRRRCAMEEDGRRTEHGNRQQFDFERGSTELAGAWRGRWRSGSGTTRT